MQSSEPDSWRELQPELGSTDFSRQLTGSEIWHLLQLDIEACHITGQSPKPPFGTLVRAQFGVFEAA